MSVLKKLFAWKTDSDYKTFDEPPIPSAPVVRVNLSDLDDESGPFTTSHGSQGRRSMLWGSQLSA